MGLSPPAATSLPSASTSSSHRRTLSLADGARSSVHLASSNAAASTSAITAPPKSRRTASVSTVTPSRLNTGLHSSPGSNHWNDAPAVDPANLRTPPNRGHLRRISRDSIGTGQPSPSRSSISNSSTIIEEEPEDEDDENRISTAADADELVPLTDSVTSPFAFSTPSEQAMRQSHARQHSRIHERNLSAFFPRPGQRAEGYGDAFADPHATNQPNSAPDGVSNGVSIDKLDRSSGDDVSRKIARRGHHHKHSVSHNFFSFLGPSDASFASPQRVEQLHSSSRVTQPMHASPTFDALPSIAGKGSLDVLALAIRHLPFRSHLALTVSLAELSVGAALWIAGQNHESLATTGLGYLVVFDGLGCLSSVLLEGNAGARGWLEARTRLLRGGTVIRMPYGSSRIVILSHFAQAIYLIFSAVYVCKEAIEHVLLLHGAHDDDGAHGAGHGGMGHGESTAGTVVAEGGHIGISLPLKMLVAAAALTVFSSLLARNHAALAATVISANAPKSRAYNTASATKTLVNAFTLTTLGFSLGLIAASCVIPEAQLASLDKVVALLQSIAMFYVAYPAAVATGQILLQTSLPASAELDAILSSLRDIENHPLVVNIDQPHLWQLAPGGSSTLTRQQTCASSSLVTTISVHIKHDASDNDVIQVTQFCHERWSSTRKSAQSGAGPGELTVSVTRSAVTRSGTRSITTYNASHLQAAHSHAGHSGHSH